ncbi:DUF4232 domain-containing protein [Nocardia sp. NBC_01327]|uniref:DUF4232 domain-containing protein n=1 Tax=Nocardia sp. NBC_01327 TaxID=2903593 RepID=UPI002E12AB93|nr:DUF4232 domain-containing protein [Nocardia sp. NBC_01327]
MILGLAGCGSSTDSSGQPSQPGTAVVTSAVAGAGTSPPSDGIPAQTAQSPAPCGSGQVIVGAAVMSPGMGHRGVRLNFSVVQASSPCTLSGYPGVDSGSGGPLLHADRTLRGYLGGLPSGDDAIPTVVLDGSHSAQAVVEGVAFDSRGNGCPTYTDLHVTAPNTTDTATVSAQIDTCQLQIHPVTAPQ